MIISVSILLLSFYVLLILRYAWHWQKMPETDETTVKVKEMVTVLVPARNEEKNIVHCLDMLARQDYPAELLEVVVIDDHSEDDTAGQVHRFIQQHPGFRCSLLHLKDINAKGGSKKEAISAALEKVRSEIVMTTDADCMAGKSWVSSMVAFMQSEGLYILSGPVVFTGSSFFSGLQQLEFAGLVAIGGASIYADTPNMCNGANLAYRRQAFYEVGGYSGNEHIASGDDEFLLHKIHKRHPSRTGFLKNRKAIVKTRPAQSLREFAGQRKRWVSKSMKYENAWTTAILALVYLMHVLLVVSFTVSVHMALKLLLIKLVVDAFFYIPVLGFFRQRKLLWLLPIAEPLHILYVLYIGLAGNLSGYRWKGRQLR